MSEFVFDKSRDLYEVDQFGFVNLCEAYTSGVVSGATSVSADAFNEASYDSMMCRPDDIFAQYRQHEYVSSTLKAQAQAEASADGS